MGKIKDQSAKLVGKSKGFIADFKKFAMRGNVIDMAVAVVMGTAFNKIISSLVNDVIMPAIGAVMGGVNFSDLKYVISPAVIENGVETVPEAALKYGMFIQSVVDFLIIAFSMFIVIKLVALMSRKKEEAEEEAPPPPKPDDVVLLEEIRDLLKEKNDK